MLTKLRLRLFDDPSFSTRVKHAALEAALGMVPAAIHVFEPRTRLDRSQFRLTVRRSMTPSELWMRGEIELFASFVSRLNHCLF